MIFQTEGAEKLLAELIPTILSGFNETCVFQAEGEEKRLVELIPAIPPGSYLGTWEKD